MPVKLYFTTGISNWLCVNSDSVDTQQPITRARGVWVSLRARKDTSTWQKGTGNTDTIFLSNALPVTVTGSIWQEVSVCDTGNGVNSGFLFFMCRARVGNKYQVKHVKEETHQ